MTIVKNLASKVLAWGIKLKAQTNNQITLQTFLNCMNNAIGKKFHHVNWLVLILFEGHGCSRLSKLPSNMIERYLSLFILTCMTLIFFVTSFFNSSN